MRRCQARPGRGIWRGLAWRGWSGGARRRDEAQRRDEAMLGGVPPTRGEGSGSAGVAAPSRSGRRRRGRRPARRLRRRETAEPATRGNSYRDQADAGRPAERGRHIGVRGHDIRGDQALENGDRPARCGVHDQSGNARPATVSRGTGSRPWRWTVTAADGRRCARTKKWFDRQTSRCWLSCLGGSGGSRWHACAVGLRSVGTRIRWSRDVPDVDRPELVLA
jgi:hypothetical protein